MVTNVNPDDSFDFQMFTNGQTDRQTDPTTVTFTVHMCQGLIRADLWKVPND